MSTTLQNVLRREGDSRSLSENARYDIVSQLRQNITNKREELENVSLKSPEHFFVIKGAEVRKWVRQLQSGRIARTEYVDEKVAEVSSALTRGQIVFLYGETGAGKTEVSRLAAREVTGRQPLVVRGYSGMESAELFGHTELRASNSRAPSTIDEQIDEEFETWLRNNPTATQDSQTQQKTLITQVLIHKPSATKTEFLLGAVYQAAKEGRTVILDEANYIPPPLLAKLNDILTKKPGELITVQEDGVAPIKVAKGFSVIMTGNINRNGENRYDNRYDIDAALLDRAHLIEYESLPQATQGLPRDHRPRDKQLFSVLIASLIAQQPRPKMPKESPIQLQLIDRVGSIILPKGGLDAVWRLSQFAAATQLAFAGKITASSAFSYQKNGVQTTPKLENALSPRRLMSILESWCSDGFQDSLDSYIEKQFIHQALNSEHREYLQQLANKFGFLSNHSHTIQKAIPITGKEILEALFGTVPTRTQWPEGLQNNRAATREKQSTRLALADLKAELDDLLD